MQMQLLFTLTIFVVTFALIVIRPWGLNEAWFTALGGGMMLALGLVTPDQAYGMVVAGKDALLFLVGLLLLADLMRASGFFEWAAIHSARSAKGSGPALFRNVFILGAAVTALLSLDTTAVMLTPVVLAFVARLKLKPRPFLFACAFIANTGSLLFQVSNLTNLLFGGAFKWGFIAFTARMALPQVVALGANYLIFQGLFRKSLPARFSEEGLPEPQTAVPDKSFFQASIAVFVAVVIGYGIGDVLHVPPYIFAIVGALVLFGVGLRLGRVQVGIVREVSWSVFPFVIGLFVVVRGMENLGLARLLSSEFDSGAHSKLLTVLIGVFGAGLGSNVVNNIPMALLSISGLQHSNDLARYAALIGCNLGPNLTVMGSLATMLVISSARRQGEEVGAKDFLKVGLLVTPVLLAAGAVGLLATAWLFR